MLDCYVYLSPELRELVLCLVVSPLSWPGSPAFLELALVASAMAGGYLVAIGLRIAQGQPFELGHEIQIATTLLLVGLYSGIVLERLKRDREETKRLRRELAELARTDPLTGLGNRRHFEEALRAEVERVTRYGGVCAVAILDLDHFKRFNDRLGHPAGDAILQHVATLMRSELRITDISARIGGEEFGIVMVATEKAAAGAVIERLRQAVEAHPLLGLGARRGGHLTISGGVAGCPHDASDATQLVALADSALYDAKLAGRNRVVISGAGET